MVNTSINTDEDHIVITPEMLFVGGEDNVPLHAMERFIKCLSSTADTNKFEIHESIIMVPALPIGKANDYDSIFASDDDSSDDDKSSNDKVDDGKSRVFLTCRKGRKGVFDYCFIIHGGGEQQSVYYPTPKKHIGPGCTKSWFKRASDQLKVECKIQLRSNHDQRIEEDEVYFAGKGFGCLLKLVDTVLSKREKDVLRNNVSCYKDYSESDEKKSSAEAGDNSAEAGEKVNVNVITEAGDGSSVGLGHVAASILSYWVKTLVIRVDDPPHRFVNVPLSTEGWKGIAGRLKVLEEHEVPEEDEVETSPKKKKKKTTMSSDSMR